MTKDEARPWAQWLVSKLIDAALLGWHDAHSRSRQRLVDQGLSADDIERVQHALEELAQESWERGLARLRGAPEPEEEEESGT